MYIIGISAYYHDSSVSLFKNGELLFACEEEKFTGVKHDSSFPIKTLDYIFKKYNLNKDNVEAVCYYEDPKLKLKRVNNNISKNFFKAPFYSIKSYFTIKNNIRNIEKNLSKISKNIFYSKHHESHIYYSYYTSKFIDANCLSIDGVGESDTMVISLIKDGLMENITAASYPHSIGLFYSAMTSFLGFKPNEGEYKVMGLASYGTPLTYIDKIRELISYKNSELRCNMDFFTWDRSNTQMFNGNLIDFLGIEPREIDGPIETVHYDLAAAVQKCYEEILFEIIRNIGMMSDSIDLCLGGGCAYNGTANGKIINNTFIKNLWIPPAPSDAGSAIGACINYLINVKKTKVKINPNPFLGPSYEDKDILPLLNNKKYYKFPNNKVLCEFVAKKIAEGKIVGWFNGRCEFGSRALGNRSILANPLLSNMKDKINRLVKKRESFRPFAPSVTKERQNEFFNLNGDVPYMNQVVQVNPYYVDILKATTHIDGTARVQTVYKDTLFHTLLREFENITSYPVLLNTSFNIKDKTMVLTPEDAMKTFFESEIDVLVLNNYVIFK